MAAFGRFLLWTLVLLAPGGVLLLPFLAAGALRAKVRAASVANPTER